MMKPSPLRNQADVELLLAVALPGLSLLLLMGCPVLAKILRAGRGCFPGLLYILCR